MTANNNSPATATITTFRWVPEMVRGLVRDVRVRWALEEAGLPYQVRLIGFEDQNTPAYRRQQPFGQVPVYQEGELTLFESGAIVHHIAECSPALMPRDPGARARTLMWMFAALNSVEPAVAMLSEADLFSADEHWSKERRPALVARVESRFADLERELQDKEYLLDRFTAADILMTTVLRYLRHTELVGKFPALAAYHERCNNRPAARKALADHLATFDPSPEQ
jgi:glutathione S-transferase